MNLTLGQFRSKSLSNLKTSSPWLLEKKKNMSVKTRLRKLYYKRKKNS